MYEHGPFALSRVRHCLAHRAIAGEEVGAVAAEDAQTGEAFDQARDVAAGSLDLDRNRYRVAVVFDEIDDPRFALTRRVERFPELTFARAAFADRDVSHFVRAIARVAV